MTRYFVLVRPHPDEAARTTPEQADAALAWNEAGEAAGLFTTICFRRTGGAYFWDADSPEQITRTLAADYPLWETITLEIDEVVPLRTGFAILKTWQAAADRHPGEEVSPARPIGGAR